MPKRAEKTYQTISLKGGWEKIFNTARVSKPRRVDFAEDRLHEPPAKKPRLWVMPEAANDNDNNNDNANAGSDDAPSPDTHYRMDPLDQLIQCINEEEEEERRRASLAVNEEKEILQANAYRDRNLNYYGEKKYKEKIFISHEHRHIDFFGLILGVGGINHRRIQALTGCRILLRGQGVRRPLSAEPFHLCVQSNEKENVNRGVAVIKKIIEQATATVAKTGSKTSIHDYGD
jgi:hypothetical protein